MTIIGQQAGPPTQRLCRAVTSSGLRHGRCSENWSRYRRRCCWDTWVTSTDQLLQRGDDVTISTPVWSWRQKSCAISF